MTSRTGNASCELEGRQCLYRANNLEAAMKSILDRSFRYTKSVDTDLRKTFARIRREQRQQGQLSPLEEGSRKVVPIGQRERATAA